MRIYNRQLHLEHAKSVYGKLGEYYRYPDEFVEYDGKVGKNPKEICPIAFYLPQYYPIQLNNENWGRGFTEWTNVCRAKPTFLGHYQPHIPERFGFYDTRVNEVLEQQAQLASNYGIKAFCFYFYCFGDQTQLGGR